MGCRLSKTVSKGEGEEAKDVVVESEDVVNGAAPPPTDQAEAETGGEGKEDKDAEPENGEQDEQQKCSICFDTKDEDGSPMVQACPQCREVICRDCIRQLFTRASTIPSEMPPKCCLPLNLVAAFPFLSNDEIERFKTKNEESRTVNPVYCPVPTCSTFISYRLFPKDKRRKVVNAKPEKKTEAGDAKTSDNADEATTTTTEEKKDNPLEETAAQPETGLTTISCPACATPICCDCKLLAHKGTPCTQDHNDIDEDMRKFLIKYRIKRCPRCRIGVRRMFGCPSMLCLCGCQWCWACGRESRVCLGEGCFPREERQREAEERAALLEEGEIDDNGSEYEEEDENDDHDDNGVGNRDQGAEGRRFDLDGGGQQEWEDNEHDFGEEADGNPDQTNCKHDFILRTETKRDVDNGFCQDCWRLAKPLTDPDTGSNEDDNDEQKISAKIEVDGYFVCSECSLSICMKCREDYADPE